MSEAVGRPTPTREEISRVIGKALDGFSKNEYGDFVALQAERIYDIAAVAVIQHLLASEVTP